METNWFGRRKDIKETTRLFFVQIWSFIYFFISSPPPALKSRSLNDGTQKRERELSASLRKVKLPLKAFRWPCKLCVWGGGKGSINNDTQISPNFKFFCGETSFNLDCLFWLLVLLHRPNHFRLSGKQLSHIRPDGWETTRSEGKKYL